MKRQWFLRWCVLAGWVGFLPLAAMGAEDKADDAAQPLALFEKLDANGDGKLTKDEVGEDQRRYFNRLLRVADKNEDGILDKAEFLAGTKPEERPAQPAAQNPGQGNSRRSEDGFKRLDQNGDGKLTLSELPEPVRERFKPIFERLGKDELTKDELERAMRAGGAFQANRSPEESFKRLDTNGDGKLTAKEGTGSTVEFLLRRAGKETDGSLTLEEYKRFVADNPRPPSGPFSGFGGPAILRELDADKDGKLSKDELAKAADHFDKLDRNNDGSLDQREILGSQGRPADADRREAMPEQVIGFLLQRYDGNKDGKLSKEELPEQMRERFFQMDKNNDGQLEADELKTGLQQFDQNSRDRNAPRPNRRPKSDD